MTWLRRTLDSSLGKKFLVAATGIALLGFLVVHLSGNLTLYADGTGRSFDAYAHTLDSNPLLPIAEVFLGLLFVAHIAFALRSNFRNREARSQGYAVRASLGRKNLSSVSMVVTGLVVLVFLLIHLYDFRIGRLSMAEGASLASLVRVRLATPLGAGVYLLGVGALAIHLRHAFRSAFQSLGVSHPKLDPVLEKLTWAVAVIFGLGFASFPIYFLATRGAA